MSLRITSPGAPLRLGGGGALVLVPPAVEPEPTAWSFASSPPYSGGDANAVGVHNGTWWLAQDVGGPLISTDGGATFAADRTGLEDMERDRKVATVLVHDLAGNTVTVLGMGTHSGGGALYRRVGGGPHELLTTSLRFAAQNAADGLPSPRPRSVGTLIAYDPASDLYYAATYEDGIYRFAPDGSGLTRVAANPATAQGYPRSIAMHPSDPDTLLVGFHGGGNGAVLDGLVRIEDVRLCATDAARTFRLGSASFDVCEDVYAVGSTVYAACGEHGVARHVTGGKVALTSTSKLSRPARALTSGTFELGVCVNLADRAGASQTLASNWNTTSLGTSGWRFWLNASGVLELRFRRSSATNAILGFAALPAGSGPLWIKVVRTGNGAGNHVAYTSPDGVAWTQLGTASSDADVGSGTQTEPWTFGATADTAGGVAGDFLRGWLIDNGVPVFGVDATGLPSGATSHVDAQGATWTFTSATVTAGWADITGALPTGAGGSTSTVQWSTVVGRDVAGAHQLLVGCCYPANIGGSNRGGSLYKTADGSTGTPTWASADGAVSTTPWGQAGPADYLVEQGRWALGKYGSGDAGGSVFHLRADGDNVVATAYGGAWRSGDFGESWAPVWGQTILSMPGIDVDPSTPGRYLIGSVDHDGYLLEGTHVTRLNPGSTAGTGLTASYGVAVDPVTGRLFLGNTHRPDNGDGGDIVWSDDDGATWSSMDLDTAIATDGGTNSRALGIVVGYNGATRIVVAFTDGSGVWRHNGTSWSKVVAAATAGGSQSNDGMETSIIWPAPTSGSTLYFFDRDKGVFRSTDRGATWTRIWNTSVPEQRTGYLAAVGANLYVARHDDVYLLAGATSGTVGSGLTAQALDVCDSPGAICVDPDGVLWVAQKASSTSDAALWRSANGTTWENVADPAWRRMSPLVNAMRAEADSLLVAQTGGGIILGALT